MSSRNGCPCRSWCGKCRPDVAKRFMAAGLAARRSLEDRLLPQIEVVNARDGWTPHLIWSGKIGHDGYGRIVHEGRLRSTHRIFWEMFVGRVGFAKVLHHECPETACMRPDHLRESTMKAHPTLHKAARAS